MIELVWGIGRPTQVCPVWERFAGLVRCTNKALLYKISSNVPLGIVSGEGSSRAHQLLTLSSPQ